MNEETNSDFHEKSISGWNFVLGSHTPLVVLYDEAEKKLKRAETDNKNRFSSTGCSAD
jgi:hypothetical protein